jgi:hypothetical protein
MADLFDLERNLGEDECVEYDPLSGIEFIWGREILAPLPEPEFDDLRDRKKIMCVHPDWFYVTRTVTMDDLVAKHGDILQVGLGPSGGFKWVRFQDRAMHGHRSLRPAAKEWAAARPRFAVKCDKLGNEINPPRRVMGRSGR